MFYRFRQLFQCRQVTLGSAEHTDFYGYNAESYTPNTELEYLRARYYNAEKGRFF